MRTFVQLGQPLGQAQVALGGQEPLYQGTVGIHKTE
jgi:hypothetical protein